MEENVGNTPEKISDIDLLMFANTTLQFLQENFGKICDINQKNKGELQKLDGNYIFDIITKGMENRTVGQIKITLTHDALLNIELNPYSHYGEYSFVGRGLDMVGLMSEMETFQSFLHDETIPGKSILKKETNYDPNEDYAELLAGYGINPDGIRKTPMPPKKVPTNKIVENKDVIENNTSKELVSDMAITPREKADIAKNILHEAFGSICDIIQEKGSLRYHINKPGVPLEGGLGQMTFTVIESGLIRVRLNVYGTNNNKYYHIEGLSNDDFLVEIDTIKSFLFDGIVPPTTSKIKEANTRGDYERDYIDQSQDTINIPKSYYSIPSLSEEQKKTMAIGETLDGWTKEKLISYIDNQKYTSVIIKKSIEGAETGYVREYVDNIPKKFKGLQLFTPAAAINLGLNDALPTDEDLSLITGPLVPEDSPKAYEKNNAIIKKFIQDNELINSGMYSANTDSLRYIDGFRYHFLLKDGKSAEVDNDSDYIQVYTKGTNKDHGYPIVLFNK